MDAYKPPVEDGEEREVYSTARLIADAIILALAIAAVWTYVMLGYP